MSSLSVGRCMAHRSHGFTATTPDFDGSILVVERDPTYEFTSTAHTNSCMRQQFSREINVRVSQFAADFVKNFREYFGGDRARAGHRDPELRLHVSGRQCRLQRGSDREARKFRPSAGPAPSIMTAEEIARLPLLQSRRHCRCQPQSCRRRLFRRWHGVSTGGSVRRAKKASNTDANEVVAMTRMRRAIESRASP